VLTVVRAYLGLTDLPFCDAAGTNQEVSDEQLALSTGGPDRPSMFQRAPSRAATNRAAVSTSSQIYEVRLLRLTWSVLV